MGVGTMNAHFINGLLDDALRKVSIQNKTIQRLHFDASKREREYDRLYETAVKIDKLYDDIPNWLKKLCIWWNK